MFKPDACVIYTACRLYLIPEDRRPNFADAYRDWGYQSWNAQNEEVFFYFILVLNMILILV